MARLQIAVVVAIALARPLVADFVLSAGNWTRRTSLFSEQHFIPGYNEAGEWDIITGGNWSETAHIDLRLLGDAAAYICKCPNPPCEPYEAGEPGGPPARPGFNTSVYTCSNPGANASFVVCSIFHAERSNITCVSPGFAVSCDIPSFHPDSPIADVDENDVVPSSSFYNDQVTSVSCIARGMGEQDIRRLANFSDSLHPLCTISPPPDFSLFRRLPFLYRQFSLSTLRKIMRVIKNMRASAALKAMARLFASAYQRKMGRGTSGHVSRMGKSWNYNGKSCTQAPWARVSATEVTLWL